MAYAAGLALVLALSAHALTLVFDAIVGVGPAQSPVSMAQSRVLADRGFSEMLKTERFWRSLRSDRSRDRSRRRDDEMRWSPRPGDLSGLEDWDEDYKDSGDEFTTYRTVCVRLCDGYYWPISFATNPERFPEDAAMCERSCSSSARLFVYRNPGQQMEQMVDLRGRPYTRLDTAFLYRSTYNAGCQCKPQPWSQETLDRHRMYALQAERRKGNRAVTKELAELKEKLRATDTNRATSVQRRADAREDEPIMRLGAQDSAPDRDRRSRSSANDDWMRRVFEH